MIEELIWFQTIFHDEINKSSRFHRLNNSFDIILYFYYFLN